MTSVSPIELSCSCGSLQIELDGANAQSGTHAMCYCEDCQAFAHALNKPDYLDTLGGTDLYQSQPHRVRIIQGADQLAVLQLKKKGLYRWYAKCCDTPICNTLGTPKMAFASFLTANMGKGAEQIGPVLFCHKPEQALGEVDIKSGPMWRFVLRAMRSTFAERLSGRWKKTPFFDISTGRSVTRPRVLSDEEREAAYRVGL